jgi:bile acid:Na+ symporter, BASS family
MQYQWALQAVIALMVFAVALELKAVDFKYVAKRPLAVAIGLIAQFVLLPGATLLATLWLDLPAPIEAAMLLVASCPGGATSNVMTHLGRGNLALSLSISAVANVLALVLTPVLFTWMVSQNPATAQWVRQIEVSPRDLLISVFLLLAVPMGLAMLTSKKFPHIAKRIQKPLERFSILMLAVFIIVGIAGRWGQFLAELTRTLPLVIAHNALGLALGYLASMLAGLNVADRRAVTIESGMQNSGLALGIIGLQFAGEPSMIAVAGLWGVWHLISGGFWAYCWRRLPVPRATSA